MNKIFYILKSILKYWIWQDVEKPNIFIQILNLVFSLFLSFCLLAWMYGEDWHLILRILISIYGVCCFMSFWPVSHLLDEKNELIGSVFYIAQNIFIFCAIYFLIIYILKKYKDDING
ncbi:hypothetical protein [Clostridium sp. B9]|uniref:hypothetical protein n=1 Tax=Clostridium sp. B9 TaxID=3423224 RepID=UPI003D2F3771